MRALPASNPRSWQAQAQIHLDHCPHGNAFFLPWHRAYLRYFEQVCREMSGDTGFALPYWNWTTQATIPAPLWEGTLDDATRVVGRSGQMPASAVGQPVIDGILATPDFETFGSSFVPSSCTTNCQRASEGYGGLEGTPHNIVHGTIGGDMGTYLSPLDPIFWLHHCNVDRLWMEWNKTFANPGNAFWRSFTFDQNFVDGQGSSVPSVPVDSLFDTLTLGYRYDTQPAAVVEGLAPVPKTANVVASVEVENTETAVMGEVLTIPLALTPEVRARLRPAPEAIRPATTVRLSLGGLATPAQPVSVNVFLGGPEAPTSIDSPNFVRSIGFFPATAAEDTHGHEKRFLLDVGAQAGRLGTGGPLQVHLQSVPMRPGPEAVGAAGVTPSSVRIEIIEHS
jgi:tyrosinase